MCGNPKTGEGKTAPTHPGPTARSGALTEKRVSFSRELPNHEQDHHNCSVNYPLRHNYLPGNTGKGERCTGRIGMAYHKAEVRNYMGNAIGLQAKQVIEICGNELEQK